MPFTYVVTGLAGGSHSVYARAYDSAGAYKDSGWVNFSIVPLGVNLVISTTVGTATCDPNATSAVKVTYFVDSNASVSMNSAPFRYVIDTTGMSKGSLHWVLCRTYGVAGNFVDSKWVSFVVK